MNSQFSGIPFVAGSIRGERCWHLRHGKLYSPQQTFEWEPSENVSKCANGAVAVNISEVLKKHFLVPGQEIYEFEYYQGQKFVITGPDCAQAFYHSKFSWEYTPEGRDAYFIVRWSKTHVDVGWYDADKPVTDPQQSMIGGEYRIKWMDFNAVVRDNYQHDHEKCTCGFYAYLNGINGYQKNCGVVGVIEGYGETTIGTRGFRAQKAKILALSPSTPIVGATKPQINTIFSMDPAKLSKDGLLKWAKVRRNGKSAVVEYDHDPVFSGTRTTIEQWAALKKNYPDVAFFSNVDLMRKEFPATEVDEIL